MVIGSSTLSRFIAVGIGAVVVAGGVQLASASSSGKIHGCEDKSNGALRIAKNCTKHEKSISWNKRGPAGKRGKKGDQGPAGAVAGFSDGPATSSTALAGDNAYHTVASVAVPGEDAGSYIATASVSIFSTAATGTPLGNCVVTDTSGTTNPVAWEVPTTTNIITAYPTLTSEVDVSTAGETVNFQCKSGVNVTAESASLSLVQVTVADH